MSIDILWLKIRYFVLMQKARFYRLINKYGIISGDFFMFMARISMQIVNWSKERMQKMVEREGHEHNRDTI